VIFGHAKDGNIHFMLTERSPAAARPLLAVHRGHGATLILGQAAR
jgi:hypothetical protein